MTQPGTRFLAWIYVLHSAVYTDDPAQRHVMADEDLHI